MDGIARVLYFEGEYMIRVITIKQPFSKLIIDGIKDVENRTWKTKHQGYIYIHVSKSYDIEKIYEYYPNFDLRDLNLGQIIGRALLTDCTKIQTSKWHISGQYGFYLAKPERINHKKIIKGKLNIWKHEDL